MTADLTTFLVERTLEWFGPIEPGLGEALEQAAEISGDTRRHLLIALNQLAPSRRDLPHHEPAPTTATLCTGRAPALGGGSPGRPPMFSQYAGPAGALT